MKYSMDQFCDYTTDRFNTAQPDMPEPSFVKRLWYGVGRIESLYQINNTTVAELQYGAYGNQRLFLHQTYIVGLVLFQKSEFLSEIMLKSICVF